LWYKGLAESEVETCFVACLIWEKPGTGHSATSGLFWSPALRAWVLERLSEEGEEKFIYAHEIAWGTGAASP
jgi:hypothetical protein